MALMCTPNTRTVTFRGLAANREKKSMWKRIYCYQYAHWETAKGEGMQCVGIAQRRRGMVLGVLMVVALMCAMAVPSLALADEAPYDDEVLNGVGSDSEVPSGNLIVGQSTIVDVNDEEDYLEPMADAPSVVVMGTLHQAEAKKLLDLVNEGRPTAKLTWDQGLERAAIQRAAETSLYLDASRPGGSNFSTLCKTGTKQAQNFAAGSVSPKELNDAFKGSATDNANMTDTQFVAMGAACFEGADGTLYWVELFSDQLSGETCNLDGAYETKVLVNETMGLEFAPSNVDGDTLVLKAGETKQVEITATCSNPASAGDVTIKPESLTWSSDSTGVATVVNGFVSAVAPTTCNVIVKPLNGSFSALSIPVSVTADIANATVSEIADQAYTGAAVTPKPTVTLAGKTLVLDKDYTLSYENNVARGKSTVTITGKGNYAGSTTRSFNIVGPGVSYATHVQTIGWQQFVYDGAVAGTEGQSKRLEGIKIKLDNPDYSGSIEYRTHVQTYGWEASYHKDGEMSGTEGESKRLEAIQIRLSGDMAEHYDVWYRVHAQTFGWMGWAKNDEQAGTAGYSKRLEGIQIMVLPKGSAAPGSTQNAFRRTMVGYRTLVQTFGWQE